MKQNMSLTDRSVRMLIAVPLFTFPFSDLATFGWQLAAVVAGFVLAITAVAGICPLYKVLGIQTLTTKSKKQEKIVE